MYIIHEAFGDEDMDIRSCFLFLDLENRFFITECSGWVVPKWVPSEDGRYIGRESKHSALDITTETLSTMSDVKRFRDKTKWIGIKIRG